MSRLIAIDDGHGMETAGKRTPIFPDGTKSPETGKNFMHENEFNRAVSKYLDADLKRCGFRTIMVAPTDADTPLATRVATANNAKADLYLSVHANANTSVWGTWGGTETFTYKLSGESYRIGKIIHKHLMKGTPLRDRGVKDGSGLYVIKNTNMPAVLVECAFMDNLEEAKLLLSDAFRRECAREIAMGICEAYGIAYVSGGTQPTPNPVQPAPTEMYRVRLNWSDAKTQIGAYTVLDFAKELADSRKSEGYKVFNSVGNVVYDPQPIKNDEVWYRVRKSWADAGSQIGAYHDVNGAKALADERANEGYKVFDEKGNIVYAPTVGVPVQQMYRVRKTWADASSQIGAYTVLNYAKELADERASEGYKVFDAGGNVVYTPTVNTEQPKPVPQPEPTPVDEHVGHADIQGKPVVDVKKMIAFVKAKNPNAQDIEEIAKHFVEVGAKYNIRGDIAFCQSIIETGWFKFDGGTAVTPDQHNYCGMGVLSKGMKGNEFTTVKEGVTAQIQHLFAYACKDVIPSGEFIVDPRFTFVTRGVAPHWEDLSNRWAMNANYGIHIIDLYKQLVAFEYIPIEKEPEDENPTPVEEVPIETPNQSDEEKQLSFWKKIVDYIFEKIAEFFGKK